MKTSEAQSRREAWREIIERQKASGKTVAGFCREQSLSVQTFYEWRRRLNGSLAPDHKSPRFALVEMNVAQPKPSTIEIVCAGGEHLLIGAGVDAATLRTVLAALRERA